jgi:hypothetical protein
MYYEIAKEIEERTRELLLICDFLNVTTDLRYR